MKLFWLFLLFSFPALAQDKDAFRSTEYPLPRFVTIASDKAYVRTGPERKYPVKWVYQYKGLPVEIILEFDHWRKIRDKDGDEGWMHQSLLSGRRGAIINAYEAVTMRRKPESDARAVAKLRPGVVVSLKECAPSHCFIKANGFKGWVDRTDLWGLYTDEIIED